MAALQFLCFVTGRVHHLSPLFLVVVIAVTFIFSLHCTILL